LLLSRAHSAIALHRVVVAVVQVGDPPIDGLR